MCVHLMGEENGKEELGGATCTASQLANEKELMRTVKPGGEGGLRWKFELASRMLPSPSAPQGSRRLQSKLTGKALNFLPLPFFSPLARIVIIIEAV